MAVVNAVILSLSLFGVIVGSVLLAENLLNLMQQAKAKYNPTWQDIYIVCRPKHLSLWMDEAAFAVLDSHGFRDYVQAFLEMRRAEKAEKKKERREKRLKRKE